MLKAAFHEDRNGPTRRLLLVNKPIQRAEALAHVAIGKRDDVFGRARHDGATARCGEPEHVIELIAADLGRTRDVAAQVEMGHEHIGLTEVRQVRCIECERTLESSRDHEVAARVRDC